MSGETLKPCPFCGGEAFTYCVDTSWWVSHACDCLGKYIETKEHKTEAEAIAAWNTRAAMEFDDWFYLPKPKQQLFSYTDGLSFDDLSMKATGTVDVYAIASAVRKWQEEALNAQIIERICEVFKPERTCRIVEYADAPMPVCSECGAVQPDDFTVYYCWNCGAKVMSE